MASTQIQCEMCSNEHAVGYCQTCGYVGETCVNIHKTGKMFQTHTVIMHEAVKMHEDGTENSKVILRDITEERCKQHPTERAIFLCKTHDSVICGRCLHSEHLSCGKEVVDLLHEVVNIDCEKVNTMKSLLIEVKDEIMFLKGEAEQSKESYKKNVDRCMQECMELGNKIKRRVDELTSGIKVDITGTHNEILATHSHITKLCNEKTKWCEDEESKIDNCVDNNMARHLYLMSRHFEKKVSDARSHLKEIKHKHIFNGVDFKENKVILKCLFEDLEEVCEQQEEVNGSDDGNANDVVTSATKIIKTRRELTALLNQAIHKLNYSEKTQKELSDELKRVRQDLYHLEKTKKTFEQELLKAKQGIEKSEKTKKKFKQELLKAKQGMKNSEKTRSELCDELIEVKHDLDDLKTTQKELNDELKRVRQDLYYSEKTKKKFKQELLKAKQGMNNSEKTRSELCDELIEVKHDLDDLKTTQKELSDELKRVRQDLYHSEKTRSELCDELIEVKHDLDDLKTERAILQTKFPLIKEQLKWTQPTVTVVVKSGRYNIILDFTFPDGIQTLHHSPGKPIKGGTFTGRLYRDSEGQLLCRMLKAALKKGVMFNSGKNGEVILEGISLYNDKVFTKWKKTSAYDKYIPTLRAELAVKGITAENIDQEEELEETFTVYGSKSR